MFVDLIEVFPGLGGLALFVFGCLYLFWWFYCLFLVVGFYVLGFGWILVLFLVLIGVWFMFGEVGLCCCG